MTAREEVTTITHQYMRNVLSATTKETVAHYLIITLTEAGEVGITTDAPSMKHIDLLFADGRETMAAILPGDWP